MSGARTPLGRHGLYSLSGRAAAILDEEDAAVLEWAAERGAEAERHAELIGADQIDRIDYFDSFPHLAHRVTAWLPELSDGPELVLTSAACYGVYFARYDSEIGDLEVVTVRQTCRRLEEEYEPMRRHREFQMREVVALGTDELVEVLPPAGQDVCRRAR